MVDELVRIRVDDVDMDACRIRITRSKGLRILEPAYEIGGHAFDFALNYDRLDLVIVDGMATAWTPLGRRR